MTRAVPDELDAIHVNVLAAQRNLAVHQQIRVAEIRGEQGVVILSHRAQQQRPRLLEQQLELGQYARIPMVEPLGISRLSSDVAAVIHDDEGVAVFQGARAALLKRVAHRNGELRSGHLVDRVRGGSRLWF